MRASGVCRHALKPLLCDDYGFTMLSSYMSLISYRLQANDLEKAVEVFGQVLQARVSRHGGKSYHQVALENKDLFKTASVASVRLPSCFISFFSRAAAPASLR